MTERTHRWIKMGIAGVVSGGSNAGLAALGVPVANAAGAGIPPLDLKQLGVMSATGAIIGLLAYLKQSPVPPDGSGDTTITKKDQ